MTDLTKHSPCGHWHKQYVAPEYTLRPSLTDVVDTGLYSPYVFSTWAYGGYFWIFNSSTTTGGGYQPDRLYKWSLTTPHTLLETYTFNKKWLAGPRGHRQPFYANQFTPSINNNTGQVLLVCDVGLVIELSTLAPSNNNYLVFPQTSEFVAYSSGGTIVYAAREGPVYSGDDHTKYITLPDQLCDMPLGSSDPGLNPLNPACVGKLDIGRGLYYSGAQFGIKSQNISNGVIQSTYQFSPSIYARGHYPLHNDGYGDYWDHTALYDLTIDEDGYVYALFSITWCNTYFGLYDQLGSYDLILAKFSVNGDGSFNLLSYRLASDVIGGLIPSGYQRGVPVYSVSHKSLEVSDGIVYWTCGQGTTVNLISLWARDLSNRIKATAPHLSSTLRAGDLWIFKRNGYPDFVIYYCGSSHIHVMDTTFVDKYVPLTLTTATPLVFYYAQVGKGSISGTRDTGCMIFPGWDGGKLLFRALKFI